MQGGLRKHLMFVCVRCAWITLPTVWVCFLWKDPLAGLKPEHFLLLSADSCDESLGNMLSSVPMQHIHGQDCTRQGGEHVFSLEAFRIENMSLYVVKCQIPNIYLENKTLCRQLLISSVIMGNGTDRWLKYQIKMAFVLCCMTISVT